MATSVPIATEQLVTQKINWIRSNTCGPKEDSKEPGDAAAYLTEDSNVRHLWSPRLDDSGGEHDGHGVIKYALAKHQHVQHRLNIKG